MSSDQFGCKVCGDDLPVSEACTIQILRPDGMESFVGDYCRDCIDDIEDELRGAENGK